MAEGNGFAARVRTMFSGAKDKQSAEYGRNDPRAMYQRISQGTRRAHGTRQSRLNRVQPLKLEALFRQEPSLQRGIYKHTGDLLKHGFHVKDQAGDALEAENEVVQAWWQDTFTNAVLRDALVSAHVYGDGLVEIEYDDGDDVDAEDPVHEAAVPVAVHLIPPHDVHFERREGGVFLVQEIPGGKKVVLHPDRYHQFCFKHVPGYVHGLSTVEAAYHAALAKLKGDQGLGELLYFSGTPKVMANLTDGNEDDVGKVAEMLNSDEFVRAWVWDERLSVEQLNPQPLDPEPYYEVLLESIAAAIGIPVMMLTGAQAGAVTGSETNLDDYHADLAQAQSITLEPFVTRIVSRLLGFTASDFSIEWQAFPMNKVREAETVREQATALSLLTGSGFTVEAAARLVGLDINAAEDLTEESGEDLPPVTSIPGTGLPGGGEGARD